VTTETNREPERRGDDASRLHSAADLIADCDDFEQVRPFVESALAETAGHLGSLTHTVLDIVLDVDMHTCLDGGYCYVCGQGRMERGA
jgi:hypothetical protein